MVRRCACASLSQTGDGSLIIRGQVNGGVSEDGFGDVIIANGARVAGDVAEADGGNISVRGGSNIDGAIEESGDGSVTIAVDMPGLVLIHVRAARAGWPSPGLRSWPKTRRAPSKGRASSLAPSTAIPCSVQVEGPLPATLQTLQQLGPSIPSGSI